MKSFRYLAALLLWAVTLSALAQGRVIVTWKEGGALLREHPMQRSQSADTAAAMGQGRADALAKRAGVPLGSGRSIGRRHQVITAAGIDSATLAKRLAGHPDVESVVIDQRRRANFIPNDPLYAAGPANGRGPDVGQWYLQPPGGNARSAINAQGAWDRVRGDPSIVVAVLDSGVLFNHPDLAGVLLPGYDMISDRFTANDGNRRDNDASDPGDWVTASEADASCGAQNSSWHGTRVSGIIGAVANDGLGIAGTAFGVRILPVRVLGKCGGFDSDIAAGMLWAAGIDQAGLPGSNTPARVFNMSFGGEGNCGSLYRDTVAEVIARNVVIVASGGNSTGRATGTPANCPGVVGVAGLRHAGSKVGFSDLGPEITISAPGGNCINTAPGTACLYTIVTSINTGTTVPLASGMTWGDAFKFSVGTSFAAPMVAGTVALMLSAKPQLTPSQVVAALQRSARPFPTTGADNGTDPEPPVCRAPDGNDQAQCFCVTGLCGAGMLDAAAAVQAVLAPDGIDEVARQLMDYGERTYPAYFPDRPVTMASAPFAYRYYPATGLYLGVVVQASPIYGPNGVYVQGGAFGPVPLFVGRVTDFITPFSSSAVSGAR